MHQTKLWEQMARHFGLREIVSRDPVDLGAKRQKWKIGIIPGSSNSPEKRWSTDNWIKLIDKLASCNEQLTFHLYGTNQDMSITNEITSFLGSACVYDHAGRTDLIELTEELASCGLVIGNDTGSIHLANMVGTEVFVLFGPTNSIKTKPFFDSSCTMIHSTDDNIKKITVADVVCRINRKKLVQ